MIASIDPASTKLALCISDADEKRLRFFETKLPSPFTPQTCDIASRYIEDIFSSYAGSNLVVVFIEAPVMVRNPQSVLKQAMVSGALQSTLLGMGHEVHLVPVTQWKKATVGKGNATKDEVRGWAEAMRPKLKKESQDVVDSYCIYIYGADVMKRVEYL